LVDLHVPGSLERAVQSSAWGGDTLLGFDVTGHGCDTAAGAWENLKASDEGEKVNVDGAWSSSDALAVYILRPAAKAVRSPIGTGLGGAKPDQAPLHRIGESRDRLLARGAGTLVSASPAQTEKLLF
jgi:hypothetical protein